VPKSFPSPLILLHSFCPYWGVCASASGPSPIQNTHCASRSRLPGPRSPSADRGERSILCANRDEYLARPTLPAHFHSFEALTAPAPSNDNVPAVQDDVKSRGRVLSGRDVQAEGTWLGISQSTGRIALL
jgi:hypothetical protein